jgi:hypothetical protein
LVPISEFGLCVLAVADRRGVKPAAWLAGIVRCSERHANRYISGARRVTARVLFAFSAAISDDLSSGRQRGNA